MVEEPLLKAIGLLLDGKLAGHSEATGKALAEGVESTSRAITAELTELIRQSAQGMTEMVAEMVDNAASARLKEQREILARSDVITTSIMSEEMDDDDLLMRFDVSLLRKDGSAIKRVRGHSTMNRALAFNGIAESPAQLESDLTMKVLRPLIGALQHTVSEMLNPKREDEAMPSMPTLLPPAHEPPPTQRAEQEHRLQEAPGASGSGQDLH